MNMNRLLVLLFRANKALHACSWHTLLHHIRRLFRDTIVYAYPLNYMNLICWNPSKYVIVALTDNSSRILADT